MKHTVQVGSRSVDQDFILCFVAGWLLITLFAWRKLLHHSSLPPGPTPLPIIGNILQMNRKDPWNTFQAWPKKYGPIMTFKIGTRTIILLNTRKVVRDLLEKRGDIYSGRPRLILIGEYLMKGFPAMMPTEKAWQTIHRLLGSVLSPRAAQTMHPIYELTAKYLLATVLDNVDADIVGALDCFTGNLYSTLLYGSHLGPITPEELKTRDQLHKEFMNGLSLEHALVDMFPVLHRVPKISASCKKKGDACMVIMRGSASSGITAAMERPWWSLIRQMSNNRPKEVTDEEFLMSTVELDVGGRGSTSLGLSIFIMMMAMHPEEMSWVQAEIDEVVGPNRLPTFTDRDKLLRLQAFLDECMRLHGMVQIGMPRAAVHDDEYMGFRIPQDAIIIHNNVALNRDPDTYEDPDLFLPRRWIDNPDLPTPALYGYGKRTCPGRHLSNNALYIGMASLAWGFRFDADRSLTDATAIGRSMFFIPRTSGIRVSCRSEAHAAVIRGEWKSVNMDPSDILNKIGECF